MTNPVERSYWDYFTDIDIPWYERAVAGAALPFMIPLSAVGCGEKDSPDSPTDDTSANDTNPTNDDTQTDDSTPQTPYADIEDLYEWDRDGYLSDTTPSNILSQVISGAISDVPADVLEHTQNNLFDRDDLDPTVYPGAPELCDGKDNDQNDLIDDNPVDGNTYYADLDGDGYGNGEDRILACELPEEDYVENSADYDDTDADINIITWYEDFDGDGYGNEESFVTSEETGTFFTPEGYVRATDANNDGVIDLLDFDADDTDSTIYPGAPELCDEKDNDQNDLVDDDPINTNTYYADLDGDGYGNPNDSLEACEAPTGYVVDNTDYDDTDPNTSWYPDTDGDGFGDETASVTTAGTPPSGYVADNTDCDDSEAAVNPAEAEVQNNQLDDDCDPSTIYLLEGNYSVADADFQASATTEHAEMGWSFASADINADGYDELFVGAPQTAETSGGGVYVLYGSVSGLTTSGYNYMSGVANGDYVGWALAKTSDFDGDGNEDIMIGAPAESTNETEAGAAYLVSSANVTTDSLDNIATTTFYGTGEYYFSGYSVASGDINGDSNPDFLIGTPNYGEGDAFQGAVYLVLGPVTGDFDLSASDTIIEGIEADQPYTGETISAGDLDGDGNDEVLIGSSTTADSGSIGVGRVDLFYGPISAATLDINDSDIRIDGDPTYGDSIGVATSLEGDFDNDGTIDLVTCDLNENSINGRVAGNGACYVFYNSTLSSSTFTAGTDQDILLTGSFDGAGYGVAVAVGDFDGDSSDDLIVGANYNGNANRIYIGGAFLYYGPVTSPTIATSSADAFFEGENFIDFAGTEVGSGDFNGDGFGDLLIAAPNYDRWSGTSNETENTGRIYTFYGLGE